MTIYNIDPIENSATLVNFEEKPDFSKFDFFGEKQLNWVPEKFKWHSDSDKYRNNNDFIFVHNSVGVGVALTEKSKKVLEPILKNDAEYLPIEIEGEYQQYYLLNILHVVENALALEKCEFRIRPNGKKGMIKKTVFEDKNIPNNRIFVYPENITLGKFKGELLKETCEKHDLSGLTFKPIDKSQIV